MWVISMSLVNNIVVGGFVRFVTVMLAANRGRPSTEEGPCHDGKECQGSDPPHEQFLHQCKSQANAGEQKPIDGTAYPCV